MISLEKILNLCESSKNYTCYMIDDDGLDHLIDQLQVSLFVAENKYTIKIEDLEKDLPQFMSTRVHCFISPEGSQSFGEHQDPMDVTIYCVVGIKTMIVDGKEIQIKSGESYFIPANTPHEATNKYRSVILSIGD